MTNNKYNKYLCNATGSKGKKLLNWYRRANLMQQSAEAVSYLHKHHHLIHRDLKASNVLVSANWTAKVADLGLGRPITGSKSSNSTEDGAGTLYAFRLSNMKLFEIEFREICTYMYVDRVLLIGYFVV